MTLEELLADVWGPDDDQQLSTLLSAATCEGVPALIRYAKVLIFAGRTPLAVGRALLWCRPLAPLNRDLREVLNYALALAVDQLGPVCVTTTVGDIPEYWEIPDGMTTPQLQALALIAEAAAHRVLLPRELGRGDVLECRHWQLLVGLETRCLSPLARRLRAGVRAG